MNRSGGGVVPKDTSCGCRYMQIDQKLGVFGLTAQLFNIGVGERLVCEAFLMVPTYDPQSPVLVIKAADMLTESIFKL